MVCGTEYLNNHLGYILPICYLLQVATRLAYGTGLAKLGKNNPRVIALDGDTKNSTYSIKLKVVLQWSIHLIIKWL